MGDPPRSGQASTQERHLLALSLLVAKACCSMSPLPPLKQWSPQRKPVMIKTYACIFVCFTTKAVHLELVTDLSSEAFLAAFTRFVGRRGYPSDVHSDNRSNFRGAWREIKEVQDLLRREETQSAIRHFSSERAIKWHFSPSRSPHFGGLWEAAVKAMKIALRKIVGNCKLSFEELLACSQMDQQNLFQRRKMVVLALSCWLVAVPSTVELFWRKPSYK